MLKTVHLFYPSFEKGGATKNLVRIVNYLLKKKSKFFFSHEELIKIILQIIKI